MRASLAESLDRGLGGDDNFSKSVHRPKTPDDPRTSTSFADAYSPTTTAPGRKKVGADLIRDTRRSPLGGFSLLTAGAQPRTTSNTCNSDSAVRFFPPAGQMPRGVGLAHADNTVTLPIPLAK